MTGQPISTTQPIIYMKAADIADIHLSDLTPGVTFMDENGNLYLYAGGDTLLNISEPQAQLLVTQLPTGSPISINVASGTTGIVQTIDVTDLKGGVFTIHAINASDSLQIKPVYQDGLDVGSSRGILVHVGASATPTEAAALNTAGTYYIRFLGCEMIQFIKTGTNGAMKVSGLVTPDRVILP